MNKLIPVVLLSLLAACSESPAPDTAPRVKAARSDGPYQPRQETGIEGYYSGKFGVESGDEKTNTIITIRIDSIRGGNVFGSSIVMGNLRPFKGTITREGNSWKMEAREPGSDSHDGVFHGAISGMVLEGEWECYDKKVKYPVRQYQLAKKAVHYDPALMLPQNARGYFRDANKVNAEGEDEAYVSETFSDAVFALNGSKQALRPSDVENLYKSDLELIRNTIYARHGYSFRNPRMRIMFDNAVDWYVPVAADVTAQLTPLELKNIALIKRYEQHAEKYYDDFGR